MKDYNWGNVHYSMFRNLYAYVLQICGCKTLRTYSIYGF